MRAPGTTGCLRDPLLGEAIGRHEKQRGEALIVARCLAAVSIAVVGAQLGGIRSSWLGAAVVLQQEAVAGPVARIAAIAIG